MIFTEFYKFSESQENPKNCSKQRCLPISEQDTFTGIVIESTFSLLPLCRCLFSLTTLNRYLPQGDNGILIFTTSTWNVFIVRHWVSLVTLLLSDFCHDSLNSV